MEPTGSNPSQQLCKHELPCWKHTLFGFARGAIIGLIVRSFLTLLTMLLKKKIFKDPLYILNIFKKNNLRMVGFLSGMIGLYRAVLCFLRKKTGNEKISSFLAGFASGIPLLFEERESRVLYALYILVRAGDAVVKHLVANGYLPKIPHIIDGLFIAAISVLHFARVWEPWNINKGYMNMLNRFITGHNDRVLIDMTGYSDKLFGFKK
ncbi:unnamed protein product [Blepharisma stoltei]|uniref:Transmembrane protein 135 N-terminal domain-containing protein n=1 Tax=Blepharisma stoltei TaxID=1481888 RepID=A0AAU9IRP2_9CILI|nr:unnamed protein product [Blepharisma stoltei]